MNVQTTRLEVRTRVVDLGGLRRYLGAIATVARYAAESRDPRETLAAARMIAEDATRGLEGHRG